MRHWLSVCALALASSGCCLGRALTSELRSPCSPEGLAEREIERMERASPPARALMLENLRLVSYECHEHIAARWGLVSDDPLPYSRLQVARVRVLARQNHYEANEIVKRLARSARIGRYQVLPGEKPAPRSRLRQLALASLIEQRSCDAECLVLLDSISHPRDPVDQLVLSQAFEREGERGLDVVGDLERALAERGDLAFARAIAHLRMIDGDAAPLLGDLIARRGEVPLTRGDHRRALDLTLEAAYALERRHAPELRLPERLRAPSLDPLWPTEELLRLVPESERSERLSVLMLELDNLSDDSEASWKADYLGSQLAVWSLPAEAARVRDEIARWLFRGGRVRAGYELETMAKAALRLDARAHENRFALARRMIEVENASVWIGHAIREGLPWWEDAAVRGWLEARVFEDSSLPSGRVFLELLRHHASDEHGQLLWHRLSLRIARALEALPRPLPDGFTEELLVLGATARWFGKERRMRELGDRARELLMASNDGSGDSGVSVVDVSLAMVGP